MYENVQKERKEFVKKELFSFQAELRGNIKEPELAGLKKKNKLFKS